MDFSSQSILPSGLTAEQSTQLATVDSDDGSEVDPAELGIIGAYSSSDPWLTDTDFAHMYRVRINHRAFTTEYLKHHYSEMVDRICKKIKNNNINGCQAKLKAWMFPDGGPPPVTPALVAMVSAYLVHNGYNKHHIRKVISFPDTAEDYWALIHLEMPTNDFLTGVSSDLHHFFHFTSKAGFYGIVSNLKDWMDSEASHQGLPLTSPIIMPTQGKDKAGDNYKGAHGLFYVDQGHAEGNSYERRQLVDMASTFGKNLINIAIYAQVNGPRAKVNGGGSDGAQDILKVAKDGVIVANLQGRKACINASHILPSGILLKLDSKGPSGWSPSSPLRLT